MGTLVCTIEMDKAAGLTVTIANADAGITQTVTMNGTTLVLKVAGNDATSTYTQDQKKIAIACTQFEVTADETITMTSTKASTYKSNDAMTLQSAKDMTQTSDANVSVSGQKIAVVGQTEVDLTGASSNTLTLAAAGATLAGGAKLALQPAGATMTGAQVSVKADGMMSLESSWVATLKGSLTNVQGSLVNLG
jgi:hypothetical protein